MSCGGMSWVMSTIVAAGLIERITPFIAATYGLPVPKSVVRVMIAHMRTLASCRTISRHISRTRLGLTLGFFFLAWPISAADGLEFAFLDLGDDLGIGGEQLAAQRFERPTRRPAGCPAPASPRRRTCPVAIISASTSRPRLVSKLAGRAPCRSARPALRPRPGNWSMSICCSLSVRSTSCWTQLLAALPSPQASASVDVIVDQRPALVHQHVAVVGRDAVGLFQPRAQLRRAVRPATRGSRSTSASVTVTGTRSGSGK